MTLLLTLADRRACGSSSCGTALLSYGRAWTWLVYRLTWRDAPGLAPASGLATSLALPLSFLTPTIVLVGVVAMIRRSTFRKQATVWKMRSGRMPSAGQGC
jgi:hypothetical protein